MKYILFFFSLVFCFGMAFSEEQACPEVDIVLDGDLYTACLLWDETEKEQMSIDFHDEEFYAFTRFENVRAQVINDGRYPRVFYFSSWNFKTIDRVCEALGHYPVPRTGDAYWTIGVSEATKVLQWNSSEDLFETSENVVRNTYDYLEFLWCPAEPLP